MGHFGFAIEIMEADLKRLRKAKPRDEMAIERCRIVLESLKHGRKQEERHNREKR